MIKINGRWKELKKKSHAFSSKSKEEIGIIRLPLL
jgi:hypothetical protein